MKCEPFETSILPPLGRSGLWSVSKKSLNMWKKSYETWTRFYSYTHKLEQILARDRAIKGVLHPLEQILLERPPTEWTSGKLVEARVTKHYPASHLPQCSEARIQMFLLLLSQFSLSVVSDYLQPHRLQHARFPSPSPAPRACQTQAHQVGDAIQPSHPLLSPSSPAFNLSQHLSLFQWIISFPLGGQSIGVLASASVLPMNIQDWFLLGWTDWMSL